MHQRTNRGPEELNMFQIQATFSGTDKLKSMIAVSIRVMATIADLRTQSAATTGIGDLTIDQMTAYYAQYGKIRSGSDFSLIGDDGLGKYQLGYTELITRGYVKHNCTSNSQLVNPNVWTGKDGVDSRSVFLESASVQEQIIEQITNSNYMALVKNGTITADLTQADVAGLISICSVLGPIETRSWRGSVTTGGTTTDQYFLSGRYSIIVLAPLMPTVNQG